MFSTWLLSFLTVWFTKFLQVICIMQSFYAEHEFIKETQLETEVWLNGRLRVNSGSWVFLVMYSSTLLYSCGQSWAPVCLRCCRVLCHERRSILLLMMQKMKSSLQLFITDHSKPFIIISRWEARAPCLIHVATSLWNYLWCYFLMPANNHSCKWKHQTL